MTDSSPVRPEKVCSKCRALPAMTGLRWCPSCSVTSAQRAARRLREAAIAAKIDASNRRHDPGAAPILPVEVSEAAAFDTLAAVGPSHSAADLARVLGPPASDRRPALGRPPRPWPPRQTTRPMRPRRP